MSQSGHILGRIEHREGHSGGQTPSVSRGKADGPESGRYQQSHPGWRIPRSSQPSSTLGLLIGKGKADLRHAAIQPRPDNGLRGLDATEPLKPTEEWSAHGWTTPAWVQDEAARDPLRRAP